MNNTKVLRTFWEKKEENDFYFRAPQASLKWNLAVDKLADSK